MTTLLLLTAFLFDIKTGKFPNWLFVLSTVIAFASLFLHQPSIGSIAWAIGSSFLVFVLLVPLVLLKAIGAGDAKLLFVFSLLAGWQTTLTVFIYSLFWGLLIGLLKLVFSGQIFNFAQSFILRTLPTSQQKIPYTAALLLGWATVLLQRGAL